MVGAVSKTNALMVQGTGSNVGKSILVAGLCRAAKNRDLKVAPFKPQNMSNNAAIAFCSDGTFGEIGRAQWLQAFACGVVPSVDMNPVLLKPQSETGSQIIVQGKLWGQAGAKDYQEIRRALLSDVVASFERLGEDADLVLVEGAGSPAEINLRDGDIANMGFAIAADVPVVLVGDIERGGVIASLVGTHTILEARDRAQIKGYMVNKFRGDPSLFDKAREQITEFTGWQDFGLLPWLGVAGQLPEEDSVWFSGSNKHGNGTIKIAVPVTGRIANFDDFDPLANEDDVELVFVRKGEMLPRDANLVVLAGTKSTLVDMAELDANGWSQQIRDYVANGGQVIGVCGGYQMLGNLICDPNKIEGNISEIAGLGLLDIQTVLDDSKTVRNSDGRSMEYNVQLSGYEIHLGNTTGDDCARAMISIEGKRDGATSRDGRVRGCYLHGLFANDEYRGALLKSLGGRSNGVGYREGLDLALDALAAEIERHLDVDGLLALAAQR